MIRICAGMAAGLESRVAQTSLASGGSPWSAGPQPSHSRLTSLTHSRNRAEHHARAVSVPLLARARSDRASESVAAIPVLPPTCSPDYHHQAAQHRAHGCQQQPTDAVLHAKRSSPLPANRTGLDRACHCRAGSYQHSRTGRYSLPEPLLSPQEKGPKRGSSQRVPMALPLGTRLSTDRLHQTIRLFQGTLPKAPAPAENQPRGPKHPRVVAPGTVRRQGRSPRCQMSMSLSISPCRYRTAATVAFTGHTLSAIHHPPIMRLGLSYEARSPRIQFRMADCVRRMPIAQRAGQETVAAVLAPAEGSLGGRVHQPTRCKTHATGMS